MTVLLQLRPQSSAIKVEYGFATGNCVSRNFEYEFSVDVAQGAHFINREKALAILQNGALVIEVRMRPVKNLPPFIPDNLFACKGIQDMYMDKQSADVVFEVGGQHATTRANAKKIKAVHTEFYVH